MRSPRLIFEKDRTVVGMERMILTAEGTDSYDVSRISVICGSRILRSLSTCATLNCDDAICLGCSALDELHFRVSAFEIATWFELRFRRVIQGSELNLVVVVCVDSDRLSACPNHIYVNLRER